MINSIETFKDCGRKVAVARNQKDEARAAFEKDFFNRCLWMENEADRKIARQAFDDAFHHFRNVPSVLHFR